MASKKSIIELEESFFDAKAEILASLAEIKHKKL